MIPNSDLLNLHSDVLKILIQLAPNGYPDGFVLRSLLVKLEETFKIFDSRRQCTSGDDLLWQQNVPRQPGDA